MQVLESSRVGLAPGSMFGQPSSSFLRICIARDPAQLEVAFDRLAKALA